MCVQRAEEGQYLEAEELKIELQRAKFEQQRERCDDFRDSQQAFLETLRVAHHQELREFETTWCATKAQFEEHALQMVRALDARLEQEREDFRAKLQSEEPRAPHYSRTVLEKRAIEERLRKQARYVEAASYKAEADALQKRELAEWQRKVNERMADAEEHFLAKQLLERSGLETRLQQILKEQTAREQAELHRMTTRFENLMSQLRTQQNIVASSMERGQVLPPHPVKKPGPSPRRLEEMALGA